MTDQLPDHPRIAAGDPDEYDNRNHNKQKIEEERAEDEINRRIQEDH